MMRKAVGYFPEPAFRIMHTGEGTTSVDSVDLPDCQFAQFGPRMPFKGHIQLAVPPEADSPLVPLEEGSIAVVRRGKCSFEAKMRAAATAGAIGVVLLNTIDETFLAVADPTASDTDIADEIPLFCAEIPFVVVPSSAGAAFVNGAQASVEPLGTGLSGETDGVVPLFPVVTEPLVPGAELKMRIGKRERDELEKAAATSGRGEGGDELGSELRVAVVYCKDPDTNLLAEHACLASVDLASSSRHVTVRGIEPCFIRTLVRDSTKDSFGLALISTGALLILDKGHPDAAERATVETAEVRRVMRNVGMLACDRASSEGFCDVGKVGAIEAELDNLPRDPVPFSFAACQFLGLPARQMQAALASSTLARLKGASRMLKRLEKRYEAAADRVDDDDDGGDLDAGEEPRAVGGGGSNFVAKAVSRVLPSVVRVEPSGAKGEKAAGFVVSSDGLIVTNRHVATAGGAPVVTFQDGEALPARLLAISENYDIAFLQVDREGLPIAPLGNGDAVQLGDWMVAIGSPAEFDNLVSLGVASTIIRPKPGDKTAVFFDRSPTFIGTDALFNKGISGGPLLNAAGEVVGMCTYMRQDLNGLGFAIAVNRVADVACELLNRNLD